MWLASLRRLVGNKTSSRKTKHSRPQRRRIVFTLNRLEDRIVPSTLTVDAGDVNNPTPPAGDYSLVGAINQANTDGSGDTINLTAGTYTITSVNNTTNGANALPEITATNLTIVGNGSTIDGASLGRLFDVAKGAGLTLENLTLTGGEAKGSTAKGGAIYNSGGNVTLNTVIVGGNQAIGGAGENGQGGGIYSNGGTLSLSKSVIGAKTTTTSTYISGSTPKVTTTKVGSANEASGGAGAQGGGLYLAGGTVHLTNCTISTNTVQGGQGGGIYSNGATLTLSNDLIGGKTNSVANHVNSASYSVKGTAVGAANKATGANGQGGGLYLAGGTVQVSSCTIADNNASSQGGGIYASGTTLNLTLNKNLIGATIVQSHNSSGAVTKQTRAGDANEVIGGAGGNVQGGGLYLGGGTVQVSSCTIAGNNAGTSASSSSRSAGAAGGNAQGGGIYATGTALTISGGSVNENVATPGSGVNGGNGTSKHLTGYAGGAAGSAQGGGIYAKGGSLTLNNGVSVSRNIFGYSTAGNGGEGYKSGAGGAGGAGSSVEGGGIYALDSKVLIGGGATINTNEAQAGDGGRANNGKNKGQGGQGGQGGEGLGGGVFVSGGSVSITGAATQINYNSAAGGNGGYGGVGGTKGVGGAGGAGGAASGGGLYVLNAPVTIMAGTSIYTQPEPSITGLSSVAEAGIANNKIRAGSGVQGGQGGGETSSRNAVSALAGGNGGAGGQAQGGGVFVSGSSMTVTVGDASHTANIVNNSASGGQGGMGDEGIKGGADGKGGAGGEAIGGGMVVTGGDTLAMTNSTVWLNQVTAGTAGLGWTGKNSSINGFGGNGQGGGLYISGGTATILNSTVGVNVAIAGQSAGTDSSPIRKTNAQGGNAQGGGLAAFSSSLTIINSTFANNQIQGSGRGEANNPNGLWQGGGLYSTKGTLTLLNDTVAWNYSFAFTTSTNPVAQGNGVYNGPSNTLNLENTIIALDEVFSNAANGETNGVFADDLNSATALGQNDDNIIGGGINSSGANESTDGNFADSDLTQGGSEALFLPGVYTNPNDKLSGAIPGNYGGLTYTMPLAWTTSPALGKGDPGASGTIAKDEGLSDANDATDQRGLPRSIDGSIDIGAVEMQLLLEGTATATVQPGGTITYTLTATNNETTAVNVTLSDVMPANTTYQTGSASGTGWTITEPSSSNNNTLSAMASLAANSSLTLTFSVTASSSVPPSTTIDNTAALAVTNNSVAAPRSLTLGTQVPGATTTDITDKVRTLRTPVFPDRDDGANDYAQAVLFFNTSGAPITGPVSLVLTNLPPGVTLTNASGYYNGDPYITIEPSNGTWKAGWWHFLFTVLDFNDPSGEAITYTPEIVQGLGTTVGTWS